MFTSFLKITLRKLYREKLYSLINISGLSIAIASCLVISLWLHSELTYDRNNIRHEQIFRMIRTNTIGNSFYTPSATGPLLVADHPEILDFVRFALIGMKEEPFIRQDDKVFQWKNVWYADGSVFDVFTHNIIYGDPKTALDAPTSVAVSRTFTEKYFGDVDPVGETIHFNSKTYTIKLVYEDLPDNTSLKYDILVSYKEKDLSDVKAGIKPLQRADCITYLLMPEGYDSANFKRIFNAFRAKYKGENSVLDNDEFWLQPLKNIHFNSSIIGGNALNMIYIFGIAAVAVFILLVACINYMNLATAMASKRAKEIAIRKNLGADRMRLTLQFLGEAILFSFIALFLGLALVEIVLPLTPMNRLLDKHLILSLHQVPAFFLWMPVFVLITGLLAGSYPAFYLSSMPIVSALAGCHRPGKGSIRFRQLLVLVQFAVTVCVIACTLVMALQMRYVSQKPMGFEKENRIVITLYGDDLIDKIPVIKTELLKNSNILGVTESNLKIGQKAGQLKLTGMDSEDVNIAFLLVGNNFFEEMGMKMVSGRDFSKRLQTDIGVSVVVNEAAVRKLGWDEPLGKQLLQFQVVGVVKDFNFRSLHSPIEPLIMIPIEYSYFNKLFGYRQLILHVSGETTSQTIAFLKDSFGEFDPEHPFQFEFLDESLNQLYVSDQRMMRLASILAGICILISCLGLFGLSAFTAEQRTKEIGIRKVLGASVWQIVSMLSHGILWLVIGGAIIASLVAYYAMNEWLNGFAYRTSIQPWVFFLSTALSAGVAFITVGLQSYKIARGNPVIALRYE